MYLDVYIYIYIYIDNALYRFNLFIRHRDSYLINLFYDLISYANHALIGLFLRKVFGKRNKGRLRQFYHGTKIKHKIKSV